MSTMHSSSGREVIVSTQKLSKEPWIRNLLCGKLVEVRTTRTTLYARVPLDDEVCSLKKTDGAGREIKKLKFHALKRLLTNLFDAHRSDLRSLNPAAGTLGEAQQSVLMAAGATFGGADNAAGAAGSGASGNGRVSGGEQAALAGKNPIASLAYDDVGSFSVAVLREHLDAADALERALAHNLLLTLEPTFRLALDEEAGYERKQLLFDRNAPEEYKAELQRAAENALAVEDALMQRRNNDDVGEKGGAGGPSAAASSVRAERRRVNKLIENARKVRNAMVGACASPYNQFFKDSGDGGEDKEEEAYPGAVKVIGRRLRLIDVNSEEHFGQFAEFLPESADVNDAKLRTRAPRLVLLPVVLVQNLRDLDAKVKEDGLGEGHGFQDWQLRAGVVRTLACRNSKDAVEGRDADATTNAKLSASRVIAPLVRNQLDDAMRKVSRMSHLSELMAHFAPLFQAAHAAANEERNFHALVKASNNGLDSKRLFKKAKAYELKKDMRVIYVNPAGERVIATIKDILPKSMYKIGIEFDAAIKERECRLDQLEVAIPLSERKESAQQKKEREAKEARAARTTASLKDPILAPLAGKSNSNYLAAAGVTELPADARPLPPAVARDMVPDLQFFLGALAAQDTERRRADPRGEDELARKGRQEFLEMLKRELEIKLRGVKARTVEYASAADNALQRRADIERVKKTQNRVPNLDEQVKLKNWLKSEEQRFWKEVLATQNRLVNNEDAVVKEFLKRYVEALGYVSQELQADAKSRMAKADALHKINPEDLKYDFVNKDDLIKDLELELLRRQGAEMMAKAVNTMMGNALFMLNGPTQADLGNIKHLSDREKAEGDLAAEERKDDELRGTVALEHRSDDYM